jgi:hypothetical protein
MNAKAITRHGRTQSVPQQRKVDFSEYGVAVDPDLSAHIAARLAQRHDVVVELAEAMQEYSLTAALIVAQAAAA